jgi:hypothetical protein
MAKVFEGKSRRTKKAAAAVSLLHIWGPEEQAPFIDLQAAIMESITFPDPGKRICILLTIDSMLARSHRYTRSSWIVQ